MKKSVLFLFVVMFVAKMECTSKVFAGMIPLVHGTAINENLVGLDSVLIEISDIKAIGFNSVDDYTGKTTHTDESGCWEMFLPAGVEFEENVFSGERKYTKYVKWVKLKMSKEGFCDTIVQAMMPEHGLKNLEIEVVMRRL